MANDEPYTAPKETPHPKDTPLDPYSRREMAELEETPHKRTLQATAKKIETTEAQLKRYLRQLGKPIPGDLRDVSIQPRMEMATNTMRGPIARRARTAQQNLETHYRKWADLCEKHLREVNSNS
jgi:hypothetical protein